MPDKPRVWSRPPGLVAAVAVLVGVLALVVLAATAGDDGSSPERPGAGSPREGGAEPGGEERGGSGSDGPTTELSSTFEPGSLETVEVEEPSTAPPVALDETGDFGTGLTLRIVRIAEVRGKARGPGEIAGPALRLVLEASNDSDDPVSLEGMVVAVEYGARHTPAVPLSEPGADPFLGELEAHGTARAVYVFNVPEGERDRIRVTTSYTGQAPTVIFRGGVR